MRGQYEYEFRALRSDEADKKIPLAETGQGEVYVEKIPLTKDSPCNWRIPVASQQPEWRYKQSDDENAVSLGPKLDVNACGPSAK
jgi:hypothetical protein